jgi:hypothetical protein
LLTESWVLHHSLSDHWEAWIGNQSLNLGESLWVKVVLTETSGTATCSCTFIHICISSVTSVTTCWHLWSLGLRDITTHEEFERDVWDHLSCSHSLDNKITWFA